MIRSKQKDMGVYMIAIAQGALIGVVGFLLMGYLITYLDKTAPVLAAAPEGLAKKRCPVVHQRIACESERVSCSD